MTLPAAIFWCLALWALFSRTRFYVYLFWLSLPFGALAAIDPSLTFGSTILPVNIAASIFIFKVGLDRQARTVMWQAATDLRGLGLLTIFCLYAIAVAYFSPRFFAGKVGILPMRMLVMDAIKPLAPTSANITQTAYLCLSWLFGIAMVGYLRTGDAAAKTQSLVLAMYLGCGVLIITGLIDFMGGRANLEFLRNGSYGIQGVTMIGNVGRISGAFAEPSSFGGAAASLDCLLFFLFPVLDKGFFKRIIAPAIVLLLFFLAVASASSTAYVGLSLALLCVAFRAATVVASGKLDRNLGGVLTVFAILSAVLISVLFFPDIFQVPMQLVDQVIFHKTATQSYAERNFWTRVGYQVFWSTSGLGAGAGSTRVSSWPAAIASSVGVVGIISMAWLLMMSYLRRPQIGNLRARHLSAAAKAFLLAFFGMAFVASTSVDPGPVMTMALAWILVGSLWRHDPALQRVGSRNHSSGILAERQRSVRMAYRYRGTTPNG